MCVCVGGGGGGSIELVVYSSLLLQLSECEDTVQQEVIAQVLYQLISFAR